MTREELREKALLAFAHAGGLGIIPDDGEKWDEDITNGMDAAIALVLDEAAKVALDEKRYGTMSVSESLVRFSVSDAIRALGK